ncbi:hypothetical protein [Variovorax paradoxus]|uniref:hypothetical protein n=1 Tax=Variovorax paradoxus TaxID=34073 RepID=UPI0024803DB3|nr:hypothetical protein [Variovorax paradoxus]WGT62809.1 hypothetical protein QHG62_22635 [Variovorax paradoxus]
MHSRLSYLRAPLALSVMAFALAACGGGDGGGGAAAGFSGTATAKDGGDNTAGKADAGSAAPDSGVTEPTVSYAP